MFPNREEPPKSQLLTTACGKVIITQVTGSEKINIIIIFLFFSYLII
jgi:hypothetical protein